MIPPFLEPWLVPMGKMIGFLIVFLVPIWNMRQEARKHRKQLDSQKEVNDAVKEAGGHVPLPAEITHPMMQYYGGVAQMDSLTQAVLANTEALNVQTGLIRQVFEFVKTSSKE